jgi:hypothetical protein
MIAFFLVIYRGRSDFLKGNPDKIILKFKIINATNEICH